MPPESELLARGYDTPEHIRRREVLRETLTALDERGSHYHAQAARNLARWQERAQPRPPTGTVEVVPGDWGAVTAELTRRYGVTFAVLNMANAYVPGGAYVEGTAAQEENLFRRTDCHYSVHDSQLQPGTDRYSREMTALLSGNDGRVYLDTEHPRVCLRGPEARDREDLGYAWLPDEAVFPFYELRAAAVDRRDGAPFDPVEMRRRIAAQLDTLRSAGLRYAVLSAFGCGAFRNPAAEVARIYRDELLLRRADFDLIAFAIFHAGYGPDNFTPFRDALG